MSAEECLRHPWLTSGYGISTSEYRHRRVADTTSNHDDDDERLLVGESKDASDWEEEDADDEGSEDHFRSDDDSDTEYKSSYAGNGKRK